MMHLDPSYSAIALAESKTREKERKRGLKPLWRILSVLFILGLGIVFLAFNWGSPYKEIHGRFKGATQIQVAGVAENYLQISTDPNDLLSIDDSTLHPTLTYPYHQLFKGEQLDVYYVDGTPKIVAAIQTYDHSGRQTTEYATADYTYNLHASPISNIGRDAGVILIVLGTLWAGVAASELVRTRRRSAITQE